jgi:hypothetical protein
VTDLRIDDHHHPDAPPLGKSGGDRGRSRYDWTTAALTGVAWLVAVLLAYGAVDARVAVLEDRYERIREDLSEIKGDLKAIRRAQ